MGNSKSSHNFSKSHRSASFSDLPYKLSNTSYNSKKNGLRPASVASTSPRQDQRRIGKSSTPTRSTSLGSLDKPNSRPISNIEAKRTSTTSLNKQMPATSTVRPSSRQFSEPQPAGLRQYNDSYLQEDTKKLFKTHDMRKTKALVEDVDDNTAEGLDKKLATLKKQRTKEEHTDDPLLKKSRKTKKAPSLPPPEKSVTFLQTTQAINGLDKAKTTSLLRKKSPAPAPPTPRTDEAVHVSNKQLGDTNNNSNNTNRQQEKITPAIDADTNRQQEKITPATDADSAIQEQKASTAVETKHQLQMSVQTEKLSDNTNGETFKRSNAGTDQDTIDPLPVRVTKTVIEREISSSKSSTNATPPSSPKGNTTINHPLSTKLTEPAQPKTLIERELTSTNKGAARKKLKKAPPAPTPSIQQPAIPKHNPELQLSINATDEHSFIEAITRQALEDSKKEHKEVAIGNNSPTDNSIECSDNSSIKEEQKGKEKAGSILKLFIDKNAEKDASRDPDESSPDTDVILADLEDKYNTKHVQTESTHSLDQDNKRALSSSPIEKSDTDPCAANETVTLQTTVDVDGGQVKSDDQQSIPVNNENGTDCKQIELEKSEAKKFETSYSENKAAGNEDHRNDDTGSVQQAVLESGNTEEQYKENIDSEPVDVDCTQYSIHRLTPESVTDQSNCASPRCTPDEQDRIVGIDVSQVNPQPTSSSLLAYARGQPNELSVITSTHNDETQSPAEVSKTLTSPAASNDSGNHEPSDISSSTTGEAHSSMQSPSLPFTQPDLSAGTVLAATRYPETTTHTSYSVGDDKEHKKHKSKYGGIFRITKTMRRFMSSVGKSSEKTHKEEEHVEPPLQDEPTIATDNWTFADNHRKPTPRKEYKPTWNDDTFKKPEEKLTQKEEHLGNSDHVEFRSSHGQEEKSDHGEAEEPTRHKEPLGNSDHLKPNSSDVERLDHEEELPTGATDVHADKNEQMTANIASTAESSKTAVLMTDIEKVEIPTPGTVVIESPKTPSLVESTAEVELRKKPSEISEPSDVTSNNITSQPPQVKRNSSALALMTPKGYGSTSAVYRPVSKATASPT